MIPELTDEDRTYCKLSGVNERVFLVSKMLNEIQTLLSKKDSMIISVDCEVQTEIEYMSPPTNNITIRIKSYVI